MKAPLAESTPGHGFFRYSCKTVSQHVSVPRCSETRWTAAIQEARRSANHPQRRTVRATELGLRRLLGRADPGSRSLTCKEGSTRARSGAGWDRVNPTDSEDYSNQNLVFVEHHPSYSVSGNSTVNARGARRSSRSVRDMIAAS